MDVTHRSAAVAEEDIDRVRSTNYSIATHKLVQINIARSSKMGTTKVHSKLVVDEHPNIVVSTEAELQSLFETEFCMRFKAEVLVTAFRCKDLGIIRTRSPTVLPLSRRLIFYSHYTNRIFRVFSIERPTDRSHLLASPTPAVTFKAHIKLLANLNTSLFRVLKFSTSGKESFTVNTAFPTRATANQVAQSNTLSRVNRTETFWSRRF